MRAIPSLTSRTVPTSSTSRSRRSAASISRRRMSLISPGRRVVSVAIFREWAEERWRGRFRAEKGAAAGRFGACEKYHKPGPAASWTDPVPQSAGHVAAPAASRRRDRRDRRAGASKGWLRLDRDDSSQRGFIFLGDDYGRARPIEERQ